MNKVIEYTIVISYMAYDMKDAVLSALKDGWQPIGGVCVNNGMFAQALVKYEDISTSLERDRVSNFDV